MNLREQIVKNGNENRIFELDAAGLGPNTISGLFRDHGINISPSDVTTVLRVSPELSKGAIPKKACRALVAALREEQRLAYAAVA